MAFKVDDRVVYPPLGIGRVARVVTQSMDAAQSQSYYEVIGDRSTVWIQVDKAPTRGLRRLTRPTELDHYRRVIRSQPVALNQDHRQRQLDLRGQWKQGTMRSLCEMVRDLSARGWAKPLNEMDALALRRSREALCREWAAADNVSLPQATAELAALLLEGRQKYEANKVEPRH